MSLRTRIADKYSIPLIFLAAILPTAIVFAIDPASMSVFLTVYGGTLGIIFITGLVAYVVGYFNEWWLR